MDKIDIDLYKVFREAYPEIVFKFKNIKMGDVMFAPTRDYMALYPETSDYESAQFKKIRDINRFVPEFLFMHKGVEIDELINDYKASLVSQLETYLLDYSTEIVPEKIHIGIRQPPQLWKYKGEKGTDLVIESTLACMFNPDHVVRRHVVIPPSGFDLDSYLAIMS